MFKKELFTKKNIHYLLLALSIMILYTTWYRTDYLAKFNLNYLVDGDNYIGLFNDFIQKGYWQSTVDGTSILFNICLSFIYYFTSDAAKSIFILNLFSLSVSLFIGFYFIVKTLKNSIYSVVLIILTISLFLYKKIPILTNDDLFSGMLFSIIIYFLYQYSIKRNIIYFGGIGVMLGLGFSVRELAILWVPLIGIFVFYYSSNINTFIRLCLIIVLPAFSIITALHFPSIKENGYLSYYDKEPEDRSLKWMQKNYLGLKKIDEGKVPLRPWGIWEGTPFSEVKEYLEANGYDSLPRTHYEAFKKDPVLFLKITLYNLYTTLKHYLAGFGLLIFLPLLLLLIRIKSLKKWGGVFIYYSAFCIFCVMICTVAYSFVEFRWFHGIENFLVLSVALSTYHLRKFKSLNLIYLISLLLILVNLIIRRI